MINRIIAILIFFLIFLEVKSQKSYQILRFNELASQEGLSEKSNDFIYKDNFGFVWISSINGLNRFDGRRVKQFKPDPDDASSIKGANIQSPFFEDINGDLWFTTSESINCYRRKRGNFDSYYISYKNSTRNAVEYTAFFLEQNRWLWTQAGDSLFRFDIQALNANKNHLMSESALFLHNLQAARFAIDTFKNGQVRCVYACYWAFRKGFEVIDYDKNYQIVKRQSYFTGLDSSKQPALTIRQAFIDNDTLVWLASDKGLVSFNPQKPYSYSIFSPKVLNTPVKNIVKINDERLWITSKESPVLVFDKKAKVFSPIQMRILNKELDDPIFSSSSNTLHLFKDSSIWLSIAKQGVYFRVFQNHLFRQPISSEKYPPLSINHIFENIKGEIGAIFSDNESGYFKINTSRATVFKKQLSPFSKVFVSKNGQYWVITTKGLIQTIDPEQDATKTVFQDDSYIFYDICNLTDKMLLIYSNKGLLYFDVNNYELKHTHIAHHSWRLHQDIKSRIWLSKVTNEGSIICYDVKNGLIDSPCREISNLGVINSFHSSPNTPSVLWVATAKGILKIDLETLKNTLFTEKEGLPTNYIQAILEDKKGYLWCSTAQGIVCFHPVLKTTKLYTKRHGLSSDSYNSNAALLSADGTMWFGGANGLDVFNPDSVRNVGHSPQAAIVGLNIHDRDWKRDIAIEMAKKIILPYNDNTLKFDLAAMEYSDPENNQFKVILEGYDRNWTYLGTQNFVTYPNLPEGIYTFKLLTANSEGIWNDIPKILIIEITPPYWRTWWFLTLIALTAMALVGYIVFLRLSKVIALQKIRLNLYENLHDDIGSRLTAIVLTIDEMKQKASVKDIKLEHIGSISRNIVANMRRLVWATAPENDSLSTVTQQMQTDRRLLLATTVDFKLTMDKNLEKISISGDKRYQMLSVFNEALTNIAKYADATEVETQINISNDQLIMIIKDNGKGFDYNAPRENTTMSSGHGLRNMRRRAQRIKGKLDIVSTIGKGTTIQLSIPINEDTFWKKIPTFFSKYHQNR